MLMCVSVCEMWGVFVFVHVCKDIRVCVFSVRVSVCMFWSTYVDVSKFMCQRGGEREIETSWKELR